MRIYFPDLRWHGLLLHKVGDKNRVLMMQYLIAEDSCFHISTSFIKLAPDYLFHKARMVRCQKYIPDDAVHVHVYTRITSFYKDLMVPVSKIEP